MGASRFIAQINKKYGTAIVENVAWEAAYEVALYRDVKHLRGSGLSILQSGLLTFAFFQTRPS